MNWNPLVSLASVGSNRPIVKDEIVDVAELEDEF